MAKPALESSMNADAAADTLNTFYVYWMSGTPLAECVKWSAEPAFLDCPLPLTQNAGPDGFMQIYLASTGHRYRLRTSHIYVVGHSGLKVDGLDTSFDNLYKPPYQH